MGVVADHAVMFDYATGIQNAGLPNPGHGPHVAMMANESPCNDCRADAHRSGGRYNGGKRPSSRPNMFGLHLAFAIVPGRGETLPAVRQNIIECPDNWKAQEILIVARINVSEDELPNS